MTILLPNGEPAKKKFALENDDRTRSFFIKKACDADLVITSKLAHELAEKITLEMGEEHGAQQGN